MAPDNSLKPLQCPPVGYDSGKVDRPSRAHTACWPASRPDYGFTKRFEGGMSVEWNLPERKFYIMRQTGSGSDRFVISGVISFDPDAGGEQVLRFLQIYAKRTIEDAQLEPDIQFKAVELDPCAPETDAWMSADAWIRFEAGNDQALTGGAEDGDGETAQADEESAGRPQIVFRGIAKAACPFCKEAVLYDPSEMMSAALTCRHCSCGFARPPRNDAVPATEADLAPLDEPDGGAAAPRGPDEAVPELKGEPKLPRATPTLAKCKHCEHVFLLSAPERSAVQCELCRGSVAWQWSIPSGPHGCEAGSSKPKLHVDQIRLFTGRSFEQFLKMLFESMGFSVEETPATADQGADLILTDASFRRTAIQAKRYCQDVGNAAVQEILGAMRYWGCSSGIVVSASGFTRAAKDLVSKIPEVTLWTSRCWRFWSIGI
jgi:hypothetical protein